MITIFTIPKAFDGHTDLIQRNAIGSWAQLNCQIILCGNDRGTEHVAKELNLEYLPNIARNEFGTPLLSSAFHEVKKSAINETLCYVNADIIFLGDFICSAKRVNMKQCLIVGNRWNVDIKDSINFGAANWELKLKECVRETGSLSPPMGSDYFVFRRDEALTNLPPFPVGRPGWDNWFIYNARKSKYKVIDASEVITAIHQNHDRSLRPACTRDEKGGPIYWEGWDSWEVPELIGQRELLRAHQPFGYKQCFRLLDATHILTEKKLKAAVDYHHLRRAFDTLPIFYPRLKPIVDLISKHVVAKIRRFRYEHRSTMQ